MKKKFRKICSILVMSIIAMTTVSAVGCAGPKQNVEGKIKISYTTAGFGEAWIYDAVEKFNSVYSSQGMEAVIGREDVNFGSENVMAEIKSVDDNDYDLYFSIGQNMVPKLIDASYSVLRTRDEVLLEDLTDVYNSYPIKLDGTKENTKIIDSRNENLMIYTQYLSKEDSPWYKKSYSFQWTSAYAGLLYNKDVLQSIGCSEPPRTTAEMFEMFDKVQALKNGVYPMTWAGKNTSGYCEYLVLTMMAQGLGKEGYENFFKLQPNTGTVEDNGYEVYDNEAILHALNAVEKIYDKKWAADGTVATIDHLMSAQRVVEGKALFAIDGEWVYNAMKGNDFTDEEINRVGIMAVPIVSDLGTTLGITEEQLRNIISLVDNGKTDAAIANEVSVAESKIAKIREARGFYCETGVTHQAFIPSYSKEKEGAKTFLRFIASEDFAKNVYAKKAYGVTANKLASVDTNNYLKSLSNVTKQSYSTPVFDASCLSKYRMGGGFTFIFQPMVSYVDMGKEFATKLKTGSQVYERAKNAIKSDWTNIIAG